MSELTWTRFADRSALHAREQAQEWRDLLGHIQSAGPYASKAACPWIKLARFGTSRSRGNSLRNNRNVLEVTGVEGDYDGEQMAPEDALTLLERAGVRAAVYTSPSHTASRPRWRVLAPLSRPLPASDRTHMLARINGALGGVLTPESFTLSQSYYYGRVNGQADYRVLVTYDDPDDGHCVDNLDNLDAIAVGPARTVPDDDSGPGASHAIAAAVEQLGRRLRTGDNRRNLLRAYIGDKSVRGLSADELGVLVKDLVGRFFDPDDTPDWSDIAGIIDAFTTEDAIRRQSVQDTVGEFVAGLSAHAGKPHTPTSALPLVWAEDVSIDAVHIEQIVEDMLTAGGLSVMYGESNSGKSFMACDMACSLGSGIVWMGKRTVAGAVLYVAGEGSESIKMRVLAWREKHGVSTQVAIVPAAVNLLDRSADVGRVIDACKAVEERYRRPVTLIVVDTLARAFGGGNENASEDMGAVITHADAIRAATGAHLLFVHHAGKDASKGSRGHSSLKAATDTEIEVTGEQETHLHTATVTKQRDLGSRGEAITAKFVVVKMGTDQWGKPVTTCVVEASNDRPAVANKDRANKLHAALITTLASARNATMRRSELVDALKEQGFTPSPIYRSIGQLAAQNVLSEVLNMIHLNGKGRA